ncbi:MAG TPA: nucleoside triphosphate pyrophosphohydrolase [Oceanobacillus sp.]|nr:nucleoside triphosphate pyrophosphohydrolase [Oceanobacillus sp.]
MSLTIVGLGPGHIDDLTRRAWRVLETAKVVYLRTSQHPCVPDLPVGAEYRSFDDVYDSTADFEQIYNTIVERLLTAAATGDVVYAVPGDPLVGESTVTRLLEKAGDLKIEIVSGISFVEPTLRLLRIDALDGLQILDAIDLAAMHHPPINPDYPALLGQVYSRAVASDLKLTLMNQYPDEFTVHLVHGAGTENERVETMPLYEIDHSSHIQHLTSLYVPALGNMSSFEQFQEIIAHLRAPEGCPWDRKQTHLSLRKYLLEEAHEVLEAIDAEDPDALREELGDLLLQVVLHTQIAIDDGEFRMGDVLSILNQKMIRRHPHVWGDVSVDGAQEVVANWDAIKQREKGEKRKSLLDGVPKGLPALLQAHEYTAKAAKPGFDWHSVDDVIAKVREELDEVLNATDDEHRAEEMGDLLFVIVNWARWLNIEPETALRKANAKFYRRFRYVEEAAAANGKPMEDYTLEELDAFWNEAKAKGL